MDDSRLELKVGALLLAALAGGVTLLALMGEIHLGGGSALTVDFAHTGNVVKGAPVKLGGVIVGRVESVSLEAERRDAHGDPLLVKMQLTVSPEAMKPLRTDAVVTVSSQGPLGEPYLELMPGSAPDALPPGAALRGLDAPRLDIVSNRLARFLESASRVLDSDPDALNKLVTGVGGLATTADGVLVENRDDLRTIARELSTTARDLRSLAATARAQLEPGGKATAVLDDVSATARAVRADYPDLSKKASVAMGGLAAVSGQFTEEDGKKLKSTLAHAQEAAEHLDAMSGRADKLLTRLEAGDGTLGALMKDKVVYDDLKSLLADLRKSPWKMLWKE